MLGKISCLLVPFVQIRRKHTVCPPEGAAAFQTPNNPVTAGRRCGTCGKKRTSYKFAPISVSSFHVSFCLFLLLALTSIQTTSLQQRLPFRCPPPPITR